MFTGLVPPRYRGHRVIDGGYSNNVPVLDQATVTVSPFSGGAHICPHHPEAPWVNIANTIVSLNADNLVRITSVLFPPSQDILARYCYQGYSDAFKFLQSREMIPPLHSEDLQRRKNRFHSVVKKVTMVSAVSLLTTIVWRNLINRPGCLTLDSTPPWQQFLADIFYWTLDTALLREPR